MGVLMINDVIKPADLISVPYEYAFPAKPQDINMLREVEQVPIPVIDFSYLTSGSPDQRSKIIEDLRNACQDWGFFLLENHGVPERLQKDLIDSCMKFFDLSQEEKSGYRGKYELDSRMALSHAIDFNTASESVSLRRDQLRACVHPTFDSPPKPEGLSEILREYTEKSREIMKELLKAIMEGLDLQEQDVKKFLEIKSSDQIFSANLYPPCPQSKPAIGLPPHLDHSLLTLLIQNDVDGLQIKNMGKWVAVDAIPNSIIVHTGDIMEVLSKGKYKSVLHRAVVNNKETRVSLVMTHGPSKETDAS